MSAVGLKSVPRPSAGAGTHGRDLADPDRTHDSDSRWPRRATLLIPALAALGVRLLTGAHPIDDAYITFRYARNLADGLGLVYNPGEWVLGTTAPLWALVLSAGYRLGLTDLPWLATSLSAVCDAVSATLLASLALKLGWRPPGAALIGLVWAINPMSVAFASGGMETSLFVLMVLVTLCLVARRSNLALAAGLAGVTTLVRPEGALLAAVVVVWTWLSRRSQTLPVVLAAGVPVAAGGLAMFLTYGSPLPHSIAAKQVAYARVGPFDNVFTLLLHAGLPAWSTFFLDAVPGAVSLLLAVFGLLALAELTRLGIPRLRARRLAWQPFAAFGVLYLSFYALIGLRGIRLFNWYLLPLQPVYLLAAAAGLARLGSRRGAWVAAALLVWQVIGVDWQQPFLPAGDPVLREQLMLEVGYDLGQSLPPTATVAAPEIGALGWASNLRILDTVGLVSPAALAYYPLAAEQMVTDNAVPARLIDDQQPDAVVALDAYAERTLLRDTPFLESYRLEHAYPAQVWLSRELLVFRRTRPPS